MTNKTAKRSLVLSVISLLLCCSMLIGTTFAWFTDEVVSGTNQILAGNLDVELYHSDKAVRNEKVTTSTKLFDDVTPALWEPGAVAYEVLTVANEGTLAMKYNLAVLFENATVVNGKTLADALKVAVVDATKLTSREAAIAAGAGAWKDFASFDLTGSLEAGKTATYGVVIYWEPTDNDNIFNMNNENKGKILSIDLGIKLTATQLTYEEDSFGDDYDGDALVCDIVATPETINEILATVEPGTVIGLAAGEYGTITLTQNDLTLVSNTAVVGLLDLNEKDNIVIDGLTFNAANAQTAYNAGGAASDFVTNLTDGKAANGGSVGVVIKNCAFVGTAADSEKYIPVYFGDTGRGNRSDVITIEGCAFQTNAKQYIALNGVTNNSGSTAGEIVIKNNIFGGNGFGTSHNTIQATGQGCNWTIIGNKFYNWGDIKTAIGSSSNGVFVTWDVIGNDFCNDEGTFPMALKTSYNASNTAVNFSNNTVWGGNGTIVPSAVNGENENVFAGQKIQINDGVAIADDNATLSDAISAGNDVIVLESGNYTLPTAAQGKTLTIVGNGDTTIDINNSLNYSLHSATVVFENVTIECNPTGAGYDRGFAHAGKIVYNNCVINGTLGLYSESEFNNCTFNISGDYYNLWTWGAPAATFNGCTFNSDGKALLLYGSANTKLTLNGCTFNDNGGLSDLKAAVEIGNDYNKSYELIVNNTVVNGYEINDKGINTGSTLWGNKNSMPQEKLNVVIDGVDVY